MEKPNGKLSEITIPTGYSADQADFYRRGYQDGQRGTPKDMVGYPADLQLAYAMGGMDGALAARPAVPARSKVHTYIGHERSLCGLAPKDGSYQIVAFEKFFIAADGDQCAACLERLARRGYGIDKLRARFRAEHINPPLPLAA